MFRERSKNKDVENRLRHSRPEPSEALLADTLRHIRAGGVYAGIGSRVRLGVALAILMVGAVAFGVFGGFSSAQSSTTSAVDSLKKLVGVSPAQQTVQRGPSASFAAAAATYPAP